MSNHSKTDDNIYHPGEVVMYQYPRNHFNNGTWVEAILKRFHTPIEPSQDEYDPKFSFIELEIRGKPWKAFSLVQIKKCGNRRQRE